MSEDHRLWPGKAKPDADSTCAWHPATFHCLDVAACADALLDANPAWLARLAEGCETSAPALKTMLVRLVALHDIGKLSEKFCRDIGLSVPVSVRGNNRSSKRHWRISFDLLIDDLDDRVARLIGVRRRHARQALYAAIAGHHGVPATFVEPDNEDRIGVPFCLAFIDDLGELLPNTGSVDLGVATAKRLSWSLAGLTVAADWIGSRQTWFPYTSHETATRAYWEVARERAVHAVGQAGLSGSALAADADCATLFGIASPRPMQRATAEVELADGPTLVVLEDMTGSGKTEAALLLAHRMMKRGLGEGLYVALPTMATANAMYDRLGDAYRRLFAPDAHPSIALAHGRRWHNRRFRDAVAFAERRANREESIAEPSTEASCAEWVADDRRKAFLGEIGVGTIDQAFLAVLPVKFSALRLFGLSQRILIVDEAHACDAYMQQELERTLRMQAAMRGSAIVMTATLTNASRQALVKAFRRGLGQDNDVTFERRAYPALTVAGADASTCRLRRVDATESLARIVPVERLEIEEEAVERLIEAASAGACCVWIRNTVDAVIRAASTLRSRGVEIVVFHARFAMCDRLDIERHVVNSFGKDGSEADRRGRVLVASQVVEASLDLDFDVMVSDIAPIDALIQRAGRLWRHVDRKPPRDRHGARLVLHVVSPDPDEHDAAVWARGERAGDAAVYGASLLWRTARALFDAGKIDAPDALPVLMEQVVGAEVPAVPETLQTYEDEMWAEQSSKRTLAGFNLVNVADGYEKASGLTDDERFPTRASLPSVRIVLLRRLAGDDDDVAFWAPGDEDGGASEVSITKYRYEKIEPRLPSRDVRIDALIESWPEWRKRDCPALIVEPDGAITEGVRYDTGSGLLFDP